MLLKIDFVEWCVDLYIPSRTSYETPQNTVFSHLFMPMFKNKYNDIIRKKWRDSSTVEWPPPDKPYPEG